MNELYFLVEHQNDKYDIIALTEVEPKYKCFEIDVAKMNLPGYNMVLSNISGPDDKHIIVYIKESINYAEVIFNTDLKESVWIKVKCHGKEFLFGCIYRSPSSTVSNHRELLSLLPTIANTYDTFSIVGDFSLPDINWNFFYM